MEEFADLRQRSVREVIGEQGEEGVAQQREIGEGVWVASARAVFPHEGVSPPVVADFNSAPVPADEFEPLGGSVLVGAGAGEVVATFGGGEPGFFDRPFAAQDDQGSGKGEVGFHRFDGEGEEAPEFNAPSSGLGVGKKGVFSKESKAWAVLSRLG